MDMTNNVRIRKRMTPPRVLVETGCWARVVAFQNAIERQASRAITPPKEQGSLRSVRIRIIDRMPTTVDRSNGPAAAGAVAVPTLRCGRDGAGVARQ